MYPFSHQTHLPSRHRGFLFQPKSKLMQLGFIHRGDLGSWVIGIRDQHIFFVRAQITNSRLCELNVLTCSYSSLVLHQEGSQRPVWTRACQCSNKTLLMGTEIWLPGNFHVTKYYSSFDFFQSFKGVKTILSMGAVQKQVADRKAFSHGLQFAIPSLGAECADTWIMSDGTHSFTGS